jgi:hypothetical protein
MRLLVTRFDNLSAHEVGQTTELQLFRAKFPSLKRDLGRVLEMMSEECDNAPSAAQQALIASPHISTDPPLPPLTHCAVLSPTFNAALTAAHLHNVGMVVAPPIQATQNHGSDDGAVLASHVTPVSSGPVIQTAMDELATSAEQPSKYLNLLLAMRNPETIFNQLKGRENLSSQEQWAYFASWTVLFLSKKEEAPNISDYSPNIPDFSPNCIFIPDERARPFSTVLGSVRIYGS